MLNTIVRYVDFYYPFYKHLPYPKPCGLHKCFLTPFLFKLNRKSIYFTIYLVQIH